MRSWMIAFATGVVVAATFPFLPATAVSAALCMCALLLHWWHKLRVVAAFVLGASWLCIYASNQLAQRWPEQMPVHDVWAEFTLISLPVATAEGQRAPVRLDTLCLSSALSTCHFEQLPADGRTVQLNFYESWHLQPGQRWRALLRLKPPHGFVNPGGFDYEAWLLQQHISATGYVRRDTDNVQLAETDHTTHLQQWRYQMVQALRNLEAGTLQHRELLQALTVGDGSEISATQWQLFADTGTTHLLVISGSHVALVMTLLYSLTHYFASRSTWLLQRWPAQAPAVFVALIGSWLYSGLAGFAIPVLRAWWMVAILLMARLWRRQLSHWHGLQMALCAVLLWDPLAVLNAGSWLSFVAVAVLLRNEQQLPTAWWLPRHWPKLALQLLWLQLQLTLVLLPIVMMAFQQISLVAPMTNLLLIPLLSVVVPLALAGVLVLLLWPAAGLWCLHLADLLIDFALRLMQWTDALLPIPLLDLPVLRQWAWPLLILCCTVTVFSARWQHKALALLALPIIMVTGRIAQVSDGGLKIEILDVGQGLAIAVHTATHHLLYDAGPQFSDSFDAGSDVVLPSLRASNVDALDRVIISHSDQDHAGGLPAIIQRFPAAYYQSSAHWLLARVSSHAACREGERWQWDGVQFQYLHPDADSYNDNNGSCVLLISVADKQVLLTGDIEKPIEQRLVQR